MNDDGFRTGISVTTQCSCGDDKESAEHVLLQCKNYGTHEDKRTVLYKTKLPDGTKPNTNPNTNPIVLCFFRASSHDLQSRHNASSASKNM